MSISTQGFHPLATNRNALQVQLISQLTTAASALQMKVFAISKKTE